MEGEWEKREGAAEKADKEGGGGQGREAEKYDVEGEVLQDLGLLPDFKVCAGRGRWEGRGV